MMADEPSLCVKMDWIPCIPIKESFWSAKSSCARVGAWLLKR